LYRLAGLNQFVTDSAGATKLGHATRLAPRRHPQRQHSHFITISLRDQPPSGFWTTAALLLLLLRVTTLLLGTGLALLTLLGLLGLALLALLLLGGVLVGALGLLSAWFKVQGRDEWLGRS
jgi:predicted permease